MVTLQQQQQQLYQHIQVYYVVTITNLILQITSQKTLKRVYIKNLR